MSQKPTIKIIEGLKKLQEFLRKAEDLRQKIAKHCSHYDYEKEVYSDQTGKVKGWVQAHGDLIKQILKLRLAIQRTNLETEVVIGIGGEAVTQSLAAWIHRRRDLAELELKAWKALQDTDTDGRPLREGKHKMTGGDQMDVVIKRHYDPEERDNALDILMNEPLLIDAKLEVTNAVTDLKYYD